MAWPEFAQVKVWVLAVKVHRIRQDIDRLGLGICIALDDNL
jgi:hypothetical protein